VFQCLALRLDKLNELRIPLLEVESDGRSFQRSSPSIAVHRLALAAPFLRPLLFAPTVIVSGRGFLHWPLKTRRKGFPGPTAPLISQIGRQQAPRPTARADPASSPAHDAFPRSSTAALRHNGLHRYSNPNGSADKR
jgi:hypothetical protein